MIHQKKLDLSEPLEKKMNEKFVNACIGDDRVLKRKTHGD